jgi:hypothetical protein
MTMRGDTIDGEDEDGDNEHETEDEPFNLNTCESMLDRAARNAHSSHGKSIVGRSPRVHRPLISVEKIGNHDYVFCNAGCTKAYNLSHESWYRFSVNNGDSELTGSRDTPR